MEVLVREVCGDCEGAFRRTLEEHTERARILAGFGDPVEVYWPFCATCRDTGYVQRWVDLGRLVKGEE